MSHPIDAQAEIKIMFLQYCNHSMVVNVQLSHFSIFEPERQEKSHQEGDAWLRIPKYCCCLIMASIGQLGSAELTSDGPGPSMKIAFIRETKYRISLHHVCIRYPCVYIYIHMYIYIY